MRDVLKNQIQALPPGDIRDRLLKIESHHPEIFTDVGANANGNLGRDDDYPRVITWDIKVYVQDPTGVFNAILDTFEPETIPIIRDHLRLSGAITTEQRRIQYSLQNEIDALRTLSANVDVLFESGYGKLK